MKNTFFGHSLACALLAAIPAIAAAQDRPAAVVRPAAVRPVDPIPDPRPEPDADLRSRFAGRYVFSVVDTHAPAGAYTAGVARMKVSRDGLFVMTVHNPSVGSSVTLTGEVTRRGHLVFVPPLGENVRAAIKILARGRIVTGLYGRYKIALGPIIDPAPGPDPLPLDPVDLGDDRGNAADLVVDVDPITHVPVVAKSGVVMGFRTAVD